MYTPLLTDTYVTGAFPTPRNKTDQTAELVLLQEVLPSSEVPEFPSGIFQRACPRAFMIVVVAGVYSAFLLHDKVTTVSAIPIDIIMVGIRIFITTPYG